MSRLYKDPEIKKICLNKGFIYNQELTHSLYWKNDNFNYLNSKYLTSVKYVNKDIVYYTLKVDSYLMALNNCLLSFSDILASLVYYCETGELCKTNLYMNNLGKKLNEKHIVLDDSFNVLLDNISYKYINALNNTAKHNGVIDTSFTLLGHVNGVTRINEIRYKSFQYKGQNFASRYANEIYNDITSVREQLKSAFNGFKKCRV